MKYVQMLEKTHKENMTKKVSDTVNVTHFGAPNDIGTEFYVVRSN